MKLFLDCEFNGFGGELISMALVDENGCSFYQVLDCPQPKAWVADNVIPHLGQEAVSRQQFQKQLRLFLNWYADIHVIADWAEDLSLFTRSLIVGAGQMMHTPPLTLELWRADQLLRSEIPHNALSDAKALAQSYQIANNPH